jgi:hypothetical protein
MLTATLAKTTNTTEDELLLKRFTPSPLGKEEVIVGRGTILPSPYPNISTAHRCAANPANSTEQRQESSKIQPSISLNLNPISPRVFDLLQSFEGLVQEVGQDSFWAELLDLTTPTNPPETIELPLSEISKPDQHLLEPGSVFYWSIGHETSPTGQIRRVAEVRFRRTPEWSQRTIESIHARAAELFRRFNEDGAGNPSTGQ